MVVGAAALGAQFLAVETAAGDGRPEALPGLVAGLERSFAEVRAALDGPRLVPGRRRSL